jgi:hypothetical protein
MDTLLIGAVIGAILWFFLSGTYKNVAQKPETLGDGELEDIFIELKKQILVTSAYDKEVTYQRVYFRIKAVLGRILERHQHFVLDVEARTPDLHRLFRRVEHRDSNGMPYFEYSVPHDLDLSQTAPELLLYLCFFLWLGGQAKGIGSVSDDPQRMIAILDHLIAQRDYSPAIFFKGMVHKYGVRVYDICDLSAARTLLEESQRRGVGDATTELLRLWKYSQLDGIKSVHPS